jgi:hypothetical protein
MAVNKSPVTPKGKSGRELVLLLGCLLVVFVVLFHKSFLPEQVLFNNDNPLGSNVQAASKMPDSFTGGWGDLNWLGTENPMATPDLSVNFQWLAGPVNYAKFWIPISLIILGLCAGFFFKSIKLSPVACVLGGLAAALDSDYFAGACWGQVSCPLALAAMFLALALLQNNSGWRGWVKVILAGMAVGWGIMEGFDKAALFSVLVGVYVVFERWVMSQAAAVNKLFWGGARLILVAGFAALLSAHALVGLIGTSISGVSVMQKSTETGPQHWDWATQWSLPKVESLGLIVPGLFGYRMDTPEGGQYWGKCGRDPAWDRYFAAGKEGPAPRGFMRFSGGSPYVAALMSVLVLWALLQSFRGQNSPYTASEKKFIWFWAGLGLGCLLLAFGRFGWFDGYPFRLFYALPFASTIRNPAKFVLLFNWSLLVLFAYGAHGLSLRFFDNTGIAAVRGKPVLRQTWWAGATAFDKKWLVGSVGAVVVCVLGWMVYASASKNLQNYLQEVGFDAGTAMGIAGFSIRQVGWAILFLTLALGSVALILGGYFTGSRAKFGGLFLGLVLVVDLGRINLPWIKYWDYQQKYATNPIIDQLRDKPYEHRVVIVPEWITEAFSLSEQARGLEQYLNQLYRIEWSQHHFLYYNIQSLDVIQMPRPPVDFVAYEGALQVHSGDTLRLMTRKWELTNTRYLLGMIGFVDLLNKQFDSGRERFRVAERFNIEPKPGISQPNKLEDLTAVPALTGNYALIEFTGALPRAKLYTNWQTSTNDDATLQTLASAAFDPAQTVLVADPTIAAPTVTTNETAGTVEFKDYAPRRIALQAQIESPSILLLNDRFASGWEVRVDGRPETLLRCNYLMRGVHLMPGKHEVEFIFQRPTNTLKITLVAMALGVVLLLALWLFRGKFPPVPEKNRP